MPEQMRKKRASDEKAISSACAGKKAEERQVA
jgi:hypothetical protein